MSKPILRRTSDYWMVRLGRLDRLNGPSSYPFPTAEAAVRFARRNARIRRVKVVNPYGRTIYAAAPREKVTHARQARRG